MQMPSRMPSNVLCFLCLGTLVDAFPRTVVQLQLVQLLQSQVQVPSRMPSNLVCFLCLGTLVVKCGGVVLRVVVCGVVRVVSCVVLFLLCLCV